MTGTFPASTLCHETCFHGGLMHIRSLYVSCLCVDKPPSSTLEEDVAFFRTCLSGMAPCLHAGTYLQADLLIEFIDTPQCPFPATFPFTAGAGPPTPRAL
jgi:hypothetical protein